MGLFQSKPKPEAQPEGESKPKSEAEDKASKMIDELEDTTMMKSDDTLIPEPTYTEEFKSTETEPSHSEEIKSTDEKSTVSYTYTEEFEPVINNVSEPIHIEDVSPAKEERASEESRTAEEAVATDETKKKKKSKRNKKQYKQADDVEVVDLIA
jgi:hypothetical protein